MVLKFYLSNHKVLRKWRMDPMYPSIRVKEVISFNHFITERQIRYIPIKISNQVIASICQKKFYTKTHRMKNGQRQKMFRDFTLR